MHRKLRTGSVVVLALLCLSFVLSACGGAATTKPTLKLAANPWDGSRANAAVAKILLEKELGYKVWTFDKKVRTASN